MYTLSKGLDSFWHVERKYNQTKPLVSKYHKKEDDLRPADRRDRKWEHIVKLSPTCYALCDGGYGDPIFTRTYARRDPIPTSIVDTYSLSPIVWDIQLQPDGSYLETVKIRNGSGDQAHTSRYQFLAEFLPTSLRYSGGTDGRQHIYIPNPDRLRQVKYYLPKSRSVGAAQWDYYVNSKSSQHWAEHYQREDDHKYLVFAREAYVPDVELMEKTGVLPNSLQPWKLISPEFKPVNPKSRVDKERKKELKPHLDEFWQWACSVGKMLAIDDWQYVRDAKATLRQHNVLKGGVWSSHDSFDGDKVQEIITTSDHELRVPLLTAYMIKSDMRYACTPEDAKRVRAHFNRWANRACGLVTTTKGE
tara:strand:- start:1714 stop:2796 length:1083 start_codon:yes stop_codon:yes gene_type:complete